MKRITLLCTASLLTLGAGASHATELIALGADGKLFKIDVADLRVAASMNVSGASDLRGLDVRPASGQLYALGGNDRLYTLDASSGKATPASTLKTALPGNSQAVVDFNPVADRLRLMSPDGTNLRVNVDTGEAVVDGKQAYGADGPYAGQQPQVVAGAYTNSYAGTPSTALYNIDLASGSLMLQNPPNDGVQQLVGKLADGLQTAALDIASDGKGGNTAYVLTGKTLHRLDLLRWDAGSGQLHLEVHCSSGTYIRSLARDLGQALGCGGCLASLRRTQALGFHDHQASPLPDADRDDPPPEPLSPLLALGHLPQHQLSPSEQIDWRCGRRLELGAGPGEAVVVCNPDGSMAGIGLREAPNLLRPKVVFDAAG